MTFYVDSAGRWSGGGRAFLNNARHAAERHPILRGVPGSGVPIIARNLPPKGAWPKGPHIIAPQNAWPWNPVARGPRERAHVVALRAASEISLRRASAMMRISSAIPEPGRIPTSPIIHNVLDDGFEAALEASATAESPWPGHIVSIGSGYSYRNLPGLLRAYREYRASGGTVPLTIAGPSGSKSAAEETQKAAQDLPGVTICWESFPRETCLAAMREASAVILPSRVEASPLTALEACAITPRVVLGDIVANREILSIYAAAPHGGDSPFADPASPTELASAMVRAVAGGAAAPWHDALSSATVRSQARVEWGEQVASWLTELSDEWGGKGTS